MPHGAVGASRNHSHRVKSLVLGRSSQRPHRSWQFTRPASAATSPTPEPGSSEGFNPASNQHLAHASSVDDHRGSPSEVVEQPQILRAPVPRPGMPTAQLHPAHFRAPAKFTMAARTTGVVQSQGRSRRTTSAAGVLAASSHGPDVRPTTGDSEAHSRSSRCHGHARLFEPLDCVTCARAEDRLTLTSRSASPWQ